MSWIVPLLEGLAAIAGIFLSQPTRFKVAVAASALIAIYSGWQAFSEHEQEKVHGELSAQAYQRLVSETNEFLAVVTEMVYSSSDGWLPSNASEFFSDRVAQGLCSDLNLNAPAPVQPPRPWWQWVASETTEFENGVSAVVAELGEYIDAETLAASHRVLNSELVSWWEAPPIIAAASPELTRAGPFRLCPGNSSLSDLANFYNSLKSEAIPDLQLFEPWARLQTWGRSEHLGSARFR